MKYLMGLDIGTSKLKTVLFTLEGEEILIKSLDLQEYVVGNQSEQDMMQIWEKTYECIKSVIDSGYDPNDILALGLSAQGEGCWLVDADGNPVQRSMRWNDGRSVVEVEKVLADSELEHFFHKTTGCQPLTPATILQLKWMKENRPEIIKRSATLFCCKDWIRFKLTGERKIEITDAIASMVDCQTKTFSAELFERLGLQEEMRLLPELIDSCVIAGYITEDASKKTGLKAGMPVSGGMVDIGACVLGTGAVNDGDICSIVGTACINISIHKEEECQWGRGNSRYTLHSKPGLCLDIMAAMSGTLNIDWVMASLYGSFDYDALESDIEDIPAGSNGVMYHPYILPVGERAPFYQPNATASFFGIGIGNTQYDMAHAVFEGIAFSIKDCLETNKKPGMIRIAGGGAKSKLWLQTIANCTGREVIVSKCTELGAKGAAITAGVAVGIFKDLDDAVGKFCSFETTYVPQDYEVKAYNELFKLYKACRVSYNDLWNMRADILSKLNKH
ncbi:MAG: FGGY-family carbohydrate kinase [Bacillota bacterium]